MNSLELNFTPFPELKTERLVLRRILMEDAQALFEMPLLKHTTISGITNGIYRFMHALYGLKVSVSVRCVKRWARIPVQKIHC